MVHSGGGIGDPTIDNLVFRYSTLSFAPTPLDTPEQSASGEQTENCLAMFAQRKGTIPT